MHLKNLPTFWCSLSLLETALKKFLYQHGPNGCIENLSIGFFEIMHIAHLITHLVKFLRKSSEIKGDKNFLKRGEVDVIKFRPLIKILLKKILMNGTITGLPLNFKFKMFAFFNIQDWPVSLNSVMWLLILVYERPISIGIFIFFKRRIFIRNESVLLETILLPSYENFHWLSCAPSNFSYAISAISNIWHFYFF